MWLAGLMIIGGMVIEPLLIHPNGRFNEFETVFVLGFAIVVSLIGVYLFGSHFHSRKVDIAPAVSRHLTG